MFIAMIASAVLLIIFTIILIGSIILNALGASLGAGIEIGTTTFVICGVIIGVCALFLLGSYITIKLIGKNISNRNTKRDREENAIKQEKEKNGEIYLTTREKQALKKLVNTYPKEGAECPICGRTLTFSEGTYTDSEKISMKVEGVYKVVANTAYDVYKDEVVSVKKPCKRCGCLNCGYEWDRYSHFVTYGEETEFVTESDVRWGKFEPFMK